MTHDATLVTTSPPSSPQFTRPVDKQITLLFLAAIIIPLNLTQISYFTCCTQLYPGHTRMSNTKKKTKLRRP